MGNRECSVAIIMRLFSLHGLPVVCLFLGSGSACILAPTQKEHKEADTDTDFENEFKKIDESNGVNSEDLQLEYQDEEFPFRRFLPFPFHPPWPFHPMMRQYYKYPRHRQISQQQSVFTMPNHLKATDNLVEPDHLAIPGKPGRSRRSAFSSYMKKKNRMIEVMDSDEWWYDIDGGEMNEVSEYFKRAYPGYASAAMQREMMDLYAPALHIGQIDTGYEVNPYLSKPADRTYGDGYDFHPEDLYSMAFKPTGQRQFSSEEQLIDHLEAGKLPFGEKVILDNYWNSETVCSWYNGMNPDNVAINRYPEGFTEGRCPVGVFKLSGFNFDNGLVMFFRSTTRARRKRSNSGDLFAIKDFELEGLIIESLKKSFIDELQREANADEENADEENADEEHADEEHADKEHADKEHADEEHADEEHADEEHADEE